MKLQYESTSVAAGTACGARGRAGCESMHVPGAVDGSRGHFTNPLTRPGERQ